MGNGLTEAEKLLIAKNCFADPAKFCRTFLKHWFPTDMPWVHRAILAIQTKKCDWLLKYGELDKIERNFVRLSDPTDPKSELLPIFKIQWVDGKAVRVDMELGKHTLIMMPRGFSKTTLTNACILYSIYYGLEKVILMLSETAPHAILQLSSIKREIETNVKFNEVFGNIKPEREAPGVWQEKQIQTTRGVSVICRGRGGQVRGLNVNGDRPTLVVFDDLEDKESVGTEEQARKTADWFYADLLPVLPHHSGAIIGLGTLLGSNSVLLIIRKDPTWTSVIVGALDRDKEPIWAWAMDKEAIARKKSAYVLAGRLSVFYMEYFNVLRSDEAAKFKESYLQYKKPPVGEPLHIGIAIDPAISPKKSADYCVIVVAAMSETGEIYVLDMWCKVGATPREQVDNYFRLYSIWKPNRAGVESIAWQAALIHLLKEEMFRQHTYFEIEPITHKVKKEERVEGILQPRYAAGYIWHARRFVELEEQLLDWPNGKMDCPDALSMAIALLDPYAAQAADPTIDLGADQYKSLGSWGVDNGWENVAEANYS